MKKEQQQNMTTKRLQNFKEQAADVEPKRTPREI